MRWLGRAGALVFIAAPRGLFAVLLVGGAVIEFPRVALITIVVLFAFVFPVTLIAGRASLARKAQQSSSGDLSAMLRRLQDRESRNG